MSKSKLIQRLENLTPEEQALVSKLLGITEGVEDKPAPQAKTSKRKQKRKSEKPRKMVAVDDDGDLDDVDEQPTVKQSGGRARRVKSRKEAAQEKRVQRTGTVKGRSKGRQARVEPVDLSGNRPNRFVQMDAFKAERGDTKIDAILNKGRKPTQRREQAEFIQVECTRCRDVWEVPPTFVYGDDEGINFICDSCRGKGHK